MNKSISRKFDLVCLGTGPAASTVATTLAKQGWKVAIVESNEFGGTCALRGCNPKKIFTNSATLIEQFTRAKGRLTRGDDAHVEWSDLVAFQHEFTDPVRESSEDKFQKAGIETFHGSAQFESENTVRAGNIVLEAKKIFIGVGARPAPLNIPGEEFVVTSDDFMELRSLPSDVLFVGGGFISFEFASLVARTGTNAKIIDRHLLPLKSFDPDLVRILVKCCAAAGIEILPQTEAIAIQRNDQRLQVTLKTVNDVTQLATDLVVHGGGRVPNLEGLNLEAATVSYGKHGIVVNEYLQSTTNPVVFAAGDCAATNRPMLTTTATESGRIAAANMLSEQHSTSPSASPVSNPAQLKETANDGPVPQVVFSVPPIAAVGLLEAQARELGYDLEIRYQDLSTKGEVRKLCAAGAGCKVIIDRRTDQILGAHVLGPHAEEVINLFSLAIRFRLTTGQLKSALFSYPTMTAEYCGVL